MRMKHAAVLGVIVTLGIADSAGQQTRVAFATASVKVVDPVTADAIAASPQAAPSVAIGETTADFRRVSLGALLTRAFGVRPDQIAGPDWLTLDLIDQLRSGEARFDIHATFPPGATAAQVPEMLQALLADRFKLAFHRERRTRQSLAIVIGPGGAKLAEAGTGPPMGNALRSTPGVVHIQRERMTMSQLAGVLTSILKKPISDQTGLKGAYKVSVSVSTGDPEDGVLAKSLEPLGLKLETRSAPADYIVIDRLEKLPAPDRR